MVWLEWRGAFLIASWRKPSRPRRLGWRQTMTEEGHEERLPPTRLSAGYGFRKETIAGMRHNELDAPILLKNDLADVV